MASPYPPAEAAANPREAVVAAFDAVLELAFARALAVATDHVDHLTPAQLAMAQEATNALGLACAARLRDQRRGEGAHVV